MRTRLLASPWGLWIASAGAILLAWMLLHGSQFGNLGNSIVLDLRSSNGRIGIPVVPGLRERFVLPQESINFRPDLLNHPVCLGIDLHPDEGASGRLLVRIVTESASLAAVRLEASQVVEGSPRVCLDLPLGRLKQSGVALEISGDEDFPAQGIELVMHQPIKEPGNRRIPGLRVEVQAPWRTMQIMSALLVWAAVLAVLAVVLSAIWRDDQQVK